MTETRTPTRDERILGAFMGLCAIAYAVGAVTFPVAGDFVLRSTDALLPGLAPTPENSAGMWIVLTTSMMAMIAAASFVVWRDPARHADLSLIVVLSKAVSSGTALLFLLLAAAERRYAAYGTVIVTDFPLFVATLVLWRRAAASRK